MRGSRNNLLVKKSGNPIALTRTPMEPEGTVRIWLTTTNLFEVGQQDRYLLKDAIPVKSGSAVIDVAKLPAKYYKIVLEGRNNCLNGWAVE